MISRDGIARGTSASVALSDVRENNVILKDQAAANYSFNKGSSQNDYPTSLMGSIALLRQTYYDGQWYNKCQVLPKLQVVLKPEKMRLCLFQLVGHENNYVDKAFIQGRDINLDNLHKQLDRKFSEKYGMKVND